MNPTTEPEIEAEETRLAPVGKATVTVLRARYGMLHPSRTYPAERWAYILVIAMALALLFNHMADFGGKQLTDWRAQNDRIDRQMERDFPQEMAR